MNSADKAAKIVAASLYNIVNRHGSVPFLQKPPLKDLLYKIDKELGIVKSTNQKLYATAERRGKLKMDMSLTDAVLFLLNLVEQSPPDLSQDLMAEQILEDIRKWAAQRQQFMIPLKR